MPETNNAKYLHEYRNTYEGLKKYIIDKWKRYGLIETDQYTYEELFDAWLWCPECENCGVELAPARAPRHSNSRCMDHCHKTGIFRNILCNACNVKREFYEPSGNTGV